MDNFRDQSRLPIHSVADTARWVAYFRAKETHRPDALFRDPFAERLAGEHGFQIANQLKDGNKHEWAWVTRTYLFDNLIMEELNSGADLVLCLAAGLDARPYRLKLSASLQWLEIDFSEVLMYKEEVIAGEKPNCRLRRIPMDLLDTAARQTLLAEINSSANNIVVITEGLLPYLREEEVASLAQDLSSYANIRSWVIDLISPGQLSLIRAGMGKELAQSGAEFRFGPVEGVSFFRPYGWEATSVEGLLKNAAILNRAPAELLRLLPEPKGSMSRYPWTGVCLLKKRIRESLELLSDIPR
jgi:methyltransferase (TIGR00027 family)